MSAVMRVIFEGGEMSPYAPICFASAEEVSCPLLLGLACGSGFCCLADIMAGCVFELFLNI